MSTRRNELMQAVKEATAAYDARMKDTENARKSLEYGFGTIKQLDTATYLESEARTRWFRASEAFVNANI